MGRWPRGPGKAAAGEKGEWRASANDGTHKDARDPRLQRLEALGQNGEESHGGGRGGSV